MKYISVILLSLIIFPAKAILAVSVDDKYRFDNLEEVSSYLNWRVSGWSVIDSRSLIVNISRSKSYLVILAHDLPAMRYTDQIKITSMNSRVRSKIDRVYVPNQNSRSTNIFAIYLLPDRTTRQDARKKILSDNFEIIEDI